MMPGMAGKIPDSKSRKKDYKRRKPPGWGRSAPSSEWDDPPRRGVFRGLVRFCFILAIWGLIFTGGVVVWYAKDLPDVARASVFKRQPSITVLDIHGNTVAVYGDIKGEALALSDFPAYLTEAVLATEDRRFYSHFGIDPIGLVRAGLKNLISGRVVQGGSTITQQLAKNLFLSQERTFRRKVQEAILALWIEQTLSKDEILSAYLNRVYMGAGAYGMDAAARVYFNKSARNVTLREAATLAGLLKAPSRYSPLNNPGLASARADTVIAAMRDAGYLEADDSPSVSKIPLPPPRKPGSVRATRYYADWVVDQIDDLIGPPDKDLIVETTLDPSVQSAAENALSRVLQEQGKARHIAQGAVMVMSTDGAVTAMIGGRDYKDSQFNRATQAFRSPGSSFKPFVYLAALEQGWTPGSMIEDAPIDSGKYRPGNYDGEYYGMVDLGTALAFSLNTATVRLMKEIGPARVVETARRLGIQASLGENLSLSLGSDGVPMIEMLRAYGVIARSGLDVEPYGIVKIRDEDGQVYYERPAGRFAARVVLPEAAQGVTGMMAQVIERGTGRGAQLPFPAAGKTGTSQDFRDAWFVGFTADYVAAVWLGNDDNTPMKKVTGGSFPAQIWRESMMAAQNTRLPARFRFDTEEDFMSSGGGNFDGLLSRLLSAPSTPDEAQRTHGNTGSPGMRGTFSLNE